MISYREQYELYEYFGYIFYYGFSNKYSYDYMQNRIANASIMKNIENHGDCRFLINSKVSNIIKDIYELNELEFDDSFTPNDISLWVSEAYLRLCFNYHKSLSYVFLYLPINEVVSMYDLYHEMDWSKLFEVFLDKINSCSLLRKLIETNNISINKLSQLTGISKNTLTTYLDDKRLKEAKFEYIYTIARVLDLDINIFASTINNHIKEEVSEVINNKEILAHLYLYVASYYSSDIANRRYLYNKDKDLFICDNNYLKVFATFDESSSQPYNHEAETYIDKYASSISLEDRRNTVIIIYEHTPISNSIKPYKKWLEYGFEKIFIINSKNVICIKESYWVSYISEDVKEKILSRLL